MTARSPASPLKPGKAGTMTHAYVRHGTTTLFAALNLQAAINRYLAEHNADPKPFVWTATPTSIIAKLEQVNASVH